MSRQEVLSASCCNDSVVAFTSKDGFDWKFSGIVANKNDFAQYEEGPNECDIALLKDKKTLFAVMRVEGGDGYPHHLHKSYISSTSTDGGVTWSTPKVMPPDVLSARHFSYAVGFPPDTSPKRCDIVLTPPKN